MVKWEAAPERATALAAPPLLPAHAAPKSRKSNSMTATNVTAIQEDDPTQTCHFTNLPSRSP